METDKIIKCNRCEGDLCYENAIANDIKTYFCMSCGFQTNSICKKDSEFYQEQSATLPELYKDLAFEDKDSLIWFPSTVKIDNMGMIFAYGAEKNEWAWAAVKAVDVLEEEKAKYPIPGKPGEFYKHRMDMSTLKLFVERDFIEALSYIGVIPN